MNGGRDWQKTEGDYFPEWLRETAAQLVNPVPAVQEVLEHVKTADDKRMFGQTNISWVANTGTLEVHNIQRYAVALHQDKGLLFYTYGFGWGVGEGKIDFRAAVDALADVGFDGWAQLETDCPTLVEDDMRRNLKSVRSLIASGNGA